MTLATSAHHQEAFRRGELIRVVNYHSTPRSSRAELDDELAAYADRFAPVTMDDLARLFDEGTWPHDRPGVIPVFYEGYRNSYDVAAPAAEKAGLTAWFPVVTQWLSTPVEYQEVFARSHWISLVEEDIGRTDRIAMSWEEVAELAQRHEIYPHTATHQGFETILTERELHTEVVEPKLRMEEVTGVPARAFAWLHGSPYGRSPLHDEALVRAGYDFLFSNTMVQRLPSGS
jgi:hypothetical protein